MGTYRLSDAARILSVSPSRLRYWEKTALVPARATEGETKGFGFRDLVYVRAVVGLLDQGVPLRRIRESVAAVRRRFPDVEDPLSALRIWTEDSDRIVVEDEGGLTEPGGQRVLDFCKSLPSGDAAVTHLSFEGKGPEARTRTAREWFERACELDSEPLHYGEAIEAYERVIEMEPGFADAHCNLGAVLYNRGRRPAARKCFERCIELVPEHLEAHFNLGNLLEEDGQEVEALEHYLAAFRSNPQHPDLQVNMALLYEKMGRVDEALHCWRRYLGIRKNGPWAQVARQRLLRSES